MSPNVPRLKPNPIPEIRPVPENLAKPTLKKMCEDTKTALQVPWVAVVTMAFALQKLRELGYRGPEIDETRATIEIFLHGNIPNLLIPTAVRLLLQGNELGTSRTISKPVQSRHGPAAGGKLVLMEPHHAERQLEGLYEDLLSRRSAYLSSTPAIARWAAGRATLM